MANKVTHTNTFTFKYADEGGNTAKIEIPFPNTNKTEQQIYDEADNIKNSNVIKSDANYYLTKILSIVRKDVEKTYLDLEALDD